MPIGSGICYTLHNIVDIMQSANRCANRKWNMLYTTQLRIFLPHESFSFPYQKYLPLENIPLKSNNNATTLGNNNKNKSLYLTKSHYTYQKVIIPTKKASYLPKSHYTYQKVIIPTKKASYLPRSASTVP